MCHPEIELEQSTSVGCPSCNPEPALCVIDGDCGDGLSNHSQVKGASDEA